MKSVRAVTTAVTVMLVTACGSVQRDTPQQPASLPTVAENPSQTAAISPATTAAPEAVSSAAPPPVTSADPAPPSPAAAPPVISDKPLPSAQDFPAVDASTPGPTNGGKCADHPQYVDEDPTGLQPEVIVAWRQVQRDAHAEGVTVCLNDGKRSAAQQQALYDAYVDQYGQAAADQLVLPPEKSAHVNGWALDVQPADAYIWLVATNGRLGLCRIYENEPWHFEYSPDYKTAGCPKLLPKPER